MKRSFGSSSLGSRPGFQFYAATAAMLCLWVSSVLGEEKKPVGWWSFDGEIIQSVKDEANDMEDSITGNFRVVRGVSGKALKLDGYTTLITRKSPKAPRLESSFTIEAWVAIAAYPWNRCPVVSHSDDNAGYALEIGPSGELVMRVFSEGTWRECVSREKVPLQAWTHVAGVFEPKNGLSVFIDGNDQGRLDFRGTMSPPQKADLVIGSVPKPVKPAFIHRDHGTLPGWYSLDAILDEVRIYSMSLKADELRHYVATKNPPTPPDISPRLLPSDSAGPGRFGAYYTRLKYYWEWDDLWRVGDHPDVVVQFDNSPVRVVFWRGTRYSPAWVSENNLWMTDQSVEAWDDEEGCFEHMQDRHCRYSHVRILENTPARVVVHWRYPLVSAHDRVWNVDPRTGWGCWIDEYYYFYPDQTGIRNYNWEKGSLGQPRQFQESIPLTGPGQVQGDVVHEQYVTVSNLAGERQTFSYIENPPAETNKPIPDNLNIQMHNFKSKNKPFIIFEPGGDMHYLRDMDIEALSRPGSCSHWPVGQMRCDGRTQSTVDRVASFLGFPITDPVIHEKGNRNWVSSLYGMNDQPFDSLLPLAKSWIHAPGLRVIAGNIKNQGYDFSQRSYRLTAEDPRESLAEFVVDASASSPMVNAFFLVENWGAKEPSVEVDGQVLKDGFGYKVGTIDTLQGTDLALWIEKESVVPVTISLASKGR